MTTINFTAEELNNIKVFMERVTMSGKEVPAYIAIMNKLHSAEMNPENDTKTTESTED